MKPNSTVSSTLAIISKSKKKCAAMSLRPARRLAGMRIPPERSYSCDICGEQYSQPQGVSRHRRKAHNIPHSCLRCEFTWTRPCQYRVHLEKCHPDVNSDKILGKPAGSRRQSKVIGRDLPQHYYHTTLQSDQRSQAELQKQPMTPLMPEVAKVTHLPSHSVLPVADELLSEYEKPAITTHKYEDAHGLHFLGATGDAPSACSSTVERVNDLDISIRGGKIRLVHAIFICHIFDV